MKEQPQKLSDVNDVELELRINKLQDIIHGLQEMQTEPPVPDERAKREQALREANDLLGVLLGEQIRRISVKLSVLADRLLLRAQGAAAQACKLQDPQEGEQQV